MADQYPTAKFVYEEWITYFADGATRQAIDIAGGWKGESSTA